MTLQRDASHGEINKIRVKDKSWWFVFLFILIRYLHNLIPYIYMIVLQTSKYKNIRKYN